MAGTRSGEVDHHVGRRLRARRSEMGMSQEKLATALGISFQQVQKYEIGIDRVSASRLWNMAKILEVDVDFKSLRYVPQPTRHHAVRANLVLLDLLIGDSERIGERFLRHAQCISALSDGLPDLMVYIAKTFPHHRPFPL